MTERPTNIEHLKRERDELRARERKARADAEKMRERFAHFTSRSKAFATVMREGTDERRRSRRRLAVQYVVSSALAEADSLQGVAPKILKILGEEFGQKFGAFWMVDEEAGLLRCGGTWRPMGTAPDPLEDACLRHDGFARSVGLPGLVWDKGEAVWIETFIEDSDPRATVMGGKNLRGGFAFPVRNGSVSAVFEFFSGEVLSPDEYLLQLATIVGEQIGQFAERKKAEKALRESEELYRLIAENSTDMISKHTPEGVYTYVSPACRSLLGYEPQELVGRTAYDFFHPEDLKAISQTHSTILRQPDTRTVAYRIRHKNGSYVWFETTSRTIRDPETGEVREILAVSRDITERKRTEEEREHFLAREWTARAQAEERRRISRELHDRVAHSMGVVHQSLELHEVLKGRDLAMAQAKMELARKTAREALALTRDLSMELRQQEVQRGLEAALKNLLRDIAPPTANYELSIEGDETLILLDARNQLFLILREAVRNAAAHSGCDQLTIELDITPQRIAGAVEDNGRGFDVGEKRPGGGLRSMEERTKLLGGTFGVSSEPGAGTKVRVTVPLEDT